MSDYNRNRAKQSIQDTFGLNDEAPAYSAWASMQANELKERRGDGYSAWEYMKDTVTGLPEQIRMYGRDMYDGGLSNNSKLRDSLNQMRSIADRQKLGFTPNAEEKAVMRDWQLLQSTGKVPTGR